LDWFNRLQPLALIVLRVVLGAVMIAHGYQKVTGFQGAQHFLSGLGLPAVAAYLVTAVEFLGGIAIVLGVYERFFAGAFAIDMMVAIWKVHYHNGFNRPGGYEFPLSLVAIAFGLVCFGGGPWGFSFGKSSSGGWGRKS
jgi:putative oxidoreductase